MSKFRYAAALTVSMMVIGAVAACTSDSTDTGPDSAETTNQTVMDPGPATTAIPSDASAIDVAEGFLTAYTDTDQTSQDWLKGLSPYLYEGLADSLTGVDPARVRFTTVTGKLTEEPAERDDNRAFSVTTDTGELSIELAALAGEWKVFAIDFDREDG